MENKKILVTGGKGYLASNLLKSLDKYNDIILYDGDVRNYKQYHNIDKIIHFAGPSDDFDFNNSKKVVDVIVNGTINMLQLAKQTNAKFIFASTKGVESPDNIYCYSKLLMEKYIQDNYDNWIILRIPRVYDKTRKKGLMKKIRLDLIPHDHMNHKVEFLTLNKFIQQTLEVDNQRNIIYNYDNLYCETISNIKKLYT